MVKSIVHGLRTGRIAENSRTDMAFDRRVGFIGVGFPKCGTTWLAKVISEHPLIDFSKGKEPHYFLSPDYEGWDQTRFCHIETDREYSKQFQNDGRVKGDYSVLYAYDPSCAERIYKYHPEVKIIICYRDPVRFLQSAFWMEKASYYATRPYKGSHVYYGQRLADTFDDQFLTFQDSKYTKYWLEKAKFLSYTQAYLGLFPSENVLVVNIDHYNENRSNLVRECYEFLGVRSDYQPRSLGDEINGATELRYHRSASVAGAFLKSLIKLRLRSLSWRIASSPVVADLYRRIFKVDFSYPPASDEVRAYISGITHESFTEMDSIASKRLAL